jgi:uncharacterized damage-inducible protein DinB
MTRPALPSIPLEPDERTALETFLDFYRAALLDRAYGLDDSQLRVGLAPSSLTLARLLGHMAFVEQIWFRNRFDGLDPVEPWASLDWEADGDAEMTITDGWSAEEITERFVAACDDSRQRAAAASSLDQRSVATSRNGEHWNLRWILVHMIEEYARHCGHADLIRESIDGDTAD